MKKWYLTRIHAVFMCTVNGICFRFKGEFYFFVRRSKSFLGQPLFELEENGYPTRESEVFPFIF